MGNSYAINKLAPIVANAVYRAIMTYEPYVHHHHHDHHTPRELKTDEDMYDHIVNYLMGELYWIFPNEVPQDLFEEDAMVLADRCVKEIQTTDHMGFDTKEGIVSFRVHVETDDGRQKTLAYIEYVVWNLYSSSEPAAGSFSQT